MREESLRPRVLSDKVRLTCAEGRLGEAVVSSPHGAKRNAGRLESAVPDSALLHPGYELLAYGRGMGGGTETEGVGAPGCKTTGRDEIASRTANPMMPAIIDNIRVIMAHRIREL